MSLSEIAREVCRATDDDEWRLQFAARSDSDRAKFVKLQLRAAALPMEDSRRLQWSEEARWLETHHPEWLNDLPKWVRAPQFHRGFVELVTANAVDFITLGHELRLTAPILHLNLERVSEAGPHAFQSKYFECIRSLALDANRLDDRYARALATSNHLRELRWLSLADNQITRDGVEAMAASSKLPQLQFVNLVGNPFDPCERFYLDHGGAASSRLPEEGTELRERYPRAVWLQRNPDFFKSYPPDRFEIGSLEQRQLSL